MTRRAIMLLAVVIMAAVSPAAAASRPAARARHVMIAGPEPLAVEEGLRVLREGGNAVDAAVTMALMLAVTYPQAGNLGGGGYMLIRLATGEPFVIDYRETAPAAASPGMFLDPSGEPIPDLSLTSYKASGVPGSVAGLALALEKAGTIPWKRALAPAIRIAREGFAVPRRLHETLAESRDRLARYATSRAVFFRQGDVLQEGDRLEQPDLAGTLQTLAREGPRSFYEGRLAGALADDMARQRGLITRADLASYKAIIRTPLQRSYRESIVLSAPPSSSGGTALLQILAMLEPYDVKALGHNSSAYVHLLAEAMKRAFADRAHWLGDPSFVKVPLTEMLSPAYAASRMRGFDPERATPAASAGPGRPGSEPEATTHLSVVDAAGNAVACTTTLNEWFGNGAIAAGLGFLLNNEMDDFSLKPGVPNLYGLVGGEANRIEPGKRMLSSMTPTIVLAGDSGGAKRIRMVLGTPGGPAIITSVLQTFLNVEEFGMDLQAAVDAPRAHHQWSPDRIDLDEAAFPDDVVKGLERRGHALQQRKPRGDMQAILADERAGWLYGASDARGYGVARGE